MWYPTCILVIPNFFLWYPTCISVIPNMYFCDTQHVFSGYPTCMFVIPNIYFCGTQDVFLWYPTCIFMIPNMYFCGTRDVFLWYPTCFFGIPNMYFWDTCVFVIPNMYFCDTQYILPRIFRRPFFQGTLTFQGSASFLGCYSQTDDSVETSRGGAISNNAPGVIHFMSDLTMERNEAEVSDNHQYGILSETTAVRDVGD